MRITESCASCLYNKQMALTDDEEYLQEIRKLLEGRRQDDTSPYMVYLFDQAHKRYFGKRADYSEAKKKQNDLVLNMEDLLRKQIEASDDPLKKALVMARVGNYIDLAAMVKVNEEEFLSLFAAAKMREEDEVAYAYFLDACSKGKRFLLIADNCGEIVLDKLFLEQLKKDFPQLLIEVMVRGEDVVNDATVADAQYVGLDKVAKIISNGAAVAGTIYGMLPQEAKEAVDQADVILAKGQGNYESLSGQGRHIFYALLCKCELFCERFNVEKLTGVFIEER